MPKYDLNMFEAVLCLKKDVGFCATFVKMVFDPPL